MPLASSRAAALAVMLTAGWFLPACGSRTPIDLVPSTSDGGSVRDGGPAAAADSGLPSPDGGDASARCGDGGPAETAYLFDGSGVLYRYDPPSGAVTTLGTPSCGNGNVPWTATFGRTTGYIVYTDWTLYSVDLATLACSLTPFQASDLGFDSEFGVAVSSTSGADRLYVYGLPPGAFSPVLAIAEPGSFTLTKVGDVAPTPTGMSFPINLTADSLGHLFAYDPGGTLLQIDETSGIVQQVLSTQVPTSGSWATVTWGSDVYLIADSLAVAYDPVAQRRLGSKDIGVFPCGGGSTRNCP